MQLDIQEIRSNTYIMPLEQLLEKLQNSRINNFHTESCDWQINKRIEFIEKIIIGIPLQAFYFSGINQMASWHIIDGHKRLDVIDSFFTKSTLKVDSPRLLRTSGKISFKDLPFQLRRRLLETEIVVHLLLGNYSSFERDEFHKIIDG